MDRNNYGESRGGFRPRDNFAPVAVGEEIDVKIEAVGEKGDGIARKRGFVLFVPNTNEGEEVHIRVTKVLRKVGFAESLGPATAPIVEESEQGERAAPAAPMPVDDEPAPVDTEDFGEEAEQTESSTDVPDLESVEDEPAPVDEPVPEAPVEEVPEAPVDAPVDAPVGDEPAPVDEPVPEAPVEEVPKEEPELDVPPPPSEPEEEVAAEPETEEKTE